MTNLLGDGKQFEIGQTIFLPTPNGIRVINTKDCYLSTVAFGEYSFMCIGRVNGYSSMALSRFYSSHDAAVESLIKERRDAIKEIEDEIDELQAMKHSKPVDKAT